MAKILVIDDERSIRNSMKDMLSFEGHEVVLAENGMEGLVSVKTEKPEVVFCDIKMPKMEGIEVLERIKEFTSDVPVIMISGHGTIDTAIEAIKKGAYDFIEKPLDLNRPDQMPDRQLRLFLHLFSWSPVPPRLTPWFPAFFQNPPGG